MLKVCKPVEVTAPHEICVGGKDFRECKTVIKTRPEQVCGYGDTFGDAIVDMREELQSMLDGTCKRIGVSCTVGKAQSAADIGPTVWQRIGEILKSMVISCNAGVENSGY